MPDMQELVHSCRVLLPSGRHEEMFYIRPSDAENLLREIERLRAERDALLACRHGEQRCDECPDTACSDNTAAEAAGGGSGD